MKQWRSVSSLGTGHNAHGSRGGWTSRRPRAGYPRMREGALRPWATTWPPSLPPTSSLRKAEVGEGWKPGDRAAEADARCRSPSNSSPAPPGLERRRLEADRQAAVAMAAQPPRLMLAASTGSAGPEPRVGGPAASPARLDRCSHRLALGHSRILLVLAPSCVLADGGGSWLGDFPVRGDRVGRPGKV